MTEPANNPFNIAMQWLLRPDVEGGYSNRPSDKGGETKYGISKRSYPQIDINNLTREGATEIYYKDYWKGPRIDELPAPLVYAVFDSVVHHRPRTAIGFLQQALDVSADGLIGPQTITAARIAVRRDGGKEALLQMLSHRAHFFAKIVVADSTQAESLRGWLLRLFRLEEFIFSMQMPKV